MIIQTKRLFQGGQAFSIRIKGAEIKKGLRSLQGYINRKTVEFSVIHAHLRHLWLKIWFLNNTFYPILFNHRLH